MNSFKIALIGFLVLLGGCQCFEFIDLEPAKGAEDPWDYDHQNTTYHGQFEAVSVSNANLKLTPFFSPDHAVDELSKFVEEAQTELDIGIPSFSSWSGCTNFFSNSTPYGCTVEYQRKEDFPVFPAVLNAVHRGVKVRLLTNWFDDEGPSEGLICPLEFLKLAGVEVRYFTTVTFLHEKYFQADRKRALVSSINFSHTSIMKNREAGVRIEGEDAGELLTYLSKVYDFDWNQSVEWPVKYHYTDKQMSVITDKSTLNVPSPTPIAFPGAYVTPLKEVSGKMDVSIFASPDHSYELLKKALDSVEEKFSLFIYQVTDKSLCGILENFVSSGKQLEMLVSRNIYGDADWKEAVKCYNSLSDAGVVFRKTCETYSYSHCKFWIIDGHTVQMSTGNWSPTDYPDRSDLGQDFPPYGDKDWIKCNRDYTVSMSHPDVVALYQKVIDEDFARGCVWKPDETWKGC